MPDFAPGYDRTWEKASLDARTMFFYYATGITRSWHGHLCPPVSVTAFGSKADCDLHSDVR
jgi:hypothetical protein